MAKSSSTILNFIGGEWQESGAAESLEVNNPATAKTVGYVPLSTSSEVDLAVQKAAQAFEDWKQVPPTERIQYLFRLKDLLEEHFEDLACTITIENGKTLNEARGEMRRAIENVEVACGIPTMMQGGILEDIAPGIDEYMLRQPLGVCAIISPFNFPGMIPFWFMPYALACGNTVIVKPSERTPLTMQKVFHLLEEAGYEEGVVNLVNGGPDTVNAILDHTEVRAVSFVGSTPVARHIYSRAAKNGKRVQAQGGAKNPILILPDADIEMTTKIVADSVFGNAGQRCLAASLVVTVGEEAKGSIVPALVESAHNRTVGYGLEEGIEMGPVITPQSKERITGLIQKGVDEGANLLLDGREASVDGYQEGNFLRPTILENLALDGEVVRTEIFGPVMGLVHVKDIDEAIAFVNSGTYGNMACLFTSSGAAARKFRNQAEAGNIGINIGVAAPMAFFPFSGWKESFFGTLHGQSNHAVEFYTQTKVVVERWPKEWSRVF
jgi:malonate-semialdehyde dehydrogenase (acetylating)/methylmalonate-semialdehyde dehydrogenase